MQTSSWPVDHAQRLVEHARDAIYSCDAAGRVTAVNRAMLVALDTDRASLIGKSPLDFVHPEHRERVESFYRDQISECAPDSYLEFPVVATTGRPIWFGQHAQLMTDGDAIAGIQVIARDITQERARTAELRRLEARCRGLVDGSPYAIFRTDVEGRITEANPALAALLGYASVADVLERASISDLCPTAQDREQIMAPLRSSGRLEGLEMAIRRPDGQIRVVRMSGRSARADAGVPPELELIVEDVTGPRLVEEQMRNIRQLEAIGQLAGGVAHNFNNLLTTVVGFADVLLESQRNSADRDALAQIQRAGRRAVRLAQQLLTFSRSRQYLPGTVDVTAAVGAVQRLMRDLVRDDVTVICQTPAEPMTVGIEANRFEQIVINLMLNAQDALPAGGTIRIDAEKAEACPAAGTHPDGFARIRVSDDGVGMSADARTRALEPFFTTKDAACGAGLGLSVVHGLVRQHGGAIEIDSAPGRGTTCTVFLPCVSGQVAEDWPPAAAGPVVLVIDDDVSVRTLIVRMLERAGYRTCQFTSGVGAVAAMEGGDPVSLVISDLRMPGIAGDDLIGELRARYPDLPCMLMSGDLGAADGVAAAAKLPSVPVLRKPFDSAALVAAVRALVGDPPR